MNRPEHAWRRLLLATMILVGILPAAGAQEVVDIDLGTFGLSTLGQLEPSRIFRPLDMIGARPGAQAWALGGAYVAQAQGVDAIGWNPAGMGWLKRPALIGEFHWTRSTAATSGFPDTFNIPNSPQLRIVALRGEPEVDGSLRDPGSGGHPQRSWVVTSRAPSSYRRYMDTTMPEAILAELSIQGAGNNGASTGSTIALDNNEHGGVDAAAATIGVELIPGQLAAGVNFNLLDGIFRSSVQSSAPSGGLGREHRLPAPEIRLPRVFDGPRRAIPQRRIGGRRRPIHAGLHACRDQGSLPFSEHPAARARTFVYRVHGVIAGYNLDVPATALHRRLVPGHSPVERRVRVRQPEVGGPDDRLPFRRVVRGSGIEADPAPA